MDRIRENTSRKQRGTTGDAKRFGFDEVKRCRDEHIDDDDDDDDDDDVFIGTYGRRPHNLTWWGGTKATWNPFDSCFP